MTVARKLTFSVCAVLLFFGLLEGILRLVYRPSLPFRFSTPHSRSVVERDAQLGYRLLPNLKTDAYATLLETNSLGFRGKELRAESSNAGHRIVALGDSCTFGFGVTDNAHTYPAQLAAL
jgi:hypothetical protein